MIFFRVCFYWSLYYWQRRWLPESWLTGWIRTALNIHHFSCIQRIACQMQVWSIPNNVSLIADKISLPFEICTVILEYCGKIFPINYSCDKETTHHWAYSIMIFPVRAQKESCVASINEYMYAEKAERPDERAELPEHGILHKYGWSGRCRQSCMQNFKWRYIFWNVRIICTVILNSGSLHKMKQAFK